MIKGYAGSYASEQSQCLIQFCFDETTKQFTKRKELPGFEDANISLMLTRNWQRYVVEMLRESLYGTFLAIKQ